jgi:hypothetical protein
MWCAAFGVSAAANRDTGGPLLRLVVAYCPTYASGALAIVEADRWTGQWAVLQQYSLPAELFGCVAMFRPAFATAASWDENTMWFDFTNQGGFVTAIDMLRGNHTSYSSRSVYTNSFTDIVDLASQSSLHGIVNTVQQGSTCAQGCLAVARCADGQSSEAGVSIVATLPFLTRVGSARFVDRGAGVVYFQVKDPIGPGQGCASDAASTCWIGVSLLTGSMVSATTLPPNATIVAVSVTSTTNGSIAVLLHGGFEDFCSMRANETTVFATLHVASGTIEPVSCMSRDNSITMDSLLWGGGFDAARGLYTAASGGWASHTTPHHQTPRILTFNVSNGELVANVTMDLLSESLGGAMGLTFFWTAVREIW